MELDDEEIKRECMDRCGICGELYLVAGNDGNSTNGKTASSNGQYTKFKFSKNLETQGVCYRCGGQDDQFVLNHREILYIVVPTKEKIEWMNSK